MRAKIAYPFSDLRRSNTVGGRIRPDGIGESGGDDKKGGYYAEDGHLVGSHFCFFAFEVWKRQWSMERRERPCEGINRHCIRAKMEFYYLISKNKINVNTLKNRKKMIKKNSGKHCTAVV